MKNEIVEQLFGIAKNSSENEVRFFIKAHWVEFPLDVQDSLAVALMTDAVREHIEALSGTTAV